MDRRLNRLRSRRTEYGCKPGPSDFPSPPDLDGIVRAYISEYRDLARRGLKYYADQKNPKRAVEKAALSKLPSGKREPHQGRIPNHVLESATRKLLAANLVNCATFHQLHRLVNEKIGGIKGIGELAVYDIAHRIGAYLGLSPRYVYLHRGTREGARALGLDPGAKFIKRSQLPKPFHRLRPYEIEDCFCIFKDELRKISAPAAV